MKQNNETSYSTELEDILSELQYSIDVATRAYEREIQATITDLKKNLS